MNVTNIEGLGVVRGGTTPAAGTITNDDMPYTPIHNHPGQRCPYRPYATQVVTTRGIVTARKYNGYFIQSREALYDADPNTSEGLQVFTSSASAGAGRRRQRRGGHRHGPASTPDCRYRTARPSPS